MARAPLRISSRTNAQFRLIRALAGSAAERRRTQRTLLDGPHLVGCYLAHAVPVMVAVAESARGDPEIGALLERARGAPLLVFSDALFDQLAPVRTPTGILAVIEIPKDEAAARNAHFVVMLEGVQDPGNVGTIIRCAAAANADAVLLSPQCADAWSPRTLRAAMGAHFAVSIRSQCDLLQAVRDFDGKVLAASGRGGVAPHQIDLSGRIALLLGAEGAGLSEPLAAAAHAAVTIPLARGIESLNVGAAAAVIAFERVRQLAGAGAARPAGRSGPARG